MAGLVRQALSGDGFYAALSTLQIPDSLTGLDDWLRGHFIYQPESFEIIRTPEFMLAEVQTEGWFSGDCDDVSTLSAAILLAYGFPAKFVAIRYHDNYEFEHVFVESGAFVLDATVPYGTEYEYKERMEEAV